MSYKFFACGCDKYSWIYPDFLWYLRVNLPAHCTLFTELYDEGSSDVVSIGKDLWFKRMLKCLNTFDCRDVVYLQEDFLVLRVDMEAIEEAYYLHKKKNANITKLGNNYEFHTHKYPMSIGHHQVYMQDIKDEYLMSHQPAAIFNRDFLVNSLECIEPMDASEHEIVGSNWMRKNGSTKVFCIGESHRYKNYSDIFLFEHAIRKGVLLDDAKPLIKKVGDKCESV